MINVGKLVADAVLDFPSRSVCKFQGWIAANLNPLEAVALKTAPKVMLLGGSPGRVFAVAV